MKKQITPLLIVLLALAFLAVPVGTAFANPIPVTGPQLENTSPAGLSAAALASFSASVATSGNPKQVAGIFAMGTFAAPIVQQPSSAPGYVSTDADSATQFEMAAQYGTIALLAHNYLLGSQFFNVDPGEVLAIVYGDGHFQTYRVVEKLEYQALSPSSPYSDFVDINDPSGQRISVTSLFNRVYAQEGKLVLQTCIDANGDPSWGRLFVIAQPEDITILIKSPPRSFEIKHFMR